MAKSSGPSTWTFRGYDRTVYPELRDPDSGVLLRDPDTGGAYVAVPGQSQLPFDPGDGFWFNPDAPPQAETGPTAPEAHDESPNPALVTEDPASRSLEPSSPSEA